MSDGSLLTEMVDAGNEEGCDLQQLFAATTGLDS